MTVKDTNIFDVQASEPYLTPDGETKYRQYVNLRLHVVTDSMERAIELFREAHPDARLHQVIKRSTVSQVIVDPLIYGVAHTVSDKIVFEAP